MYVSDETRARIEKRFPEIKDGLPYDEVFRILADAFDKKDVEYNILHKKFSLCLEQRDEKIGDFYKEKYGDRGFSDKLINLAIEDCNKELLKITEQNEII